MYKKIYTLVLFFAFQVLTLPLLAQGDTTVGKPVEMADKFRADGKIYVTIFVVLTILLGLILYVTRLDRKISKLEKTIK
jgi:ribose/xylose/arabinose/galactoside ABC-type transport system permease subunit